MTVDEDRLNELIGRFVDDLGAAVHAGNVVIGDRLGLYRALAESGPTDAAGLAARTGTAERYVREWLAGQAAGGYVSANGDADATTRRYWLSEEQCLAMVDPDGVGMAGAFQLAVACLQDEPQITDAFRSGRGVAWHEHRAEVFTGCERFFRPGYVANLVSSWLPALDGVTDRLVSGGTIADVGCGLGTSSRLMAEAFPAVHVVGFDYHDESIRLASKAAAEAGLSHRLGFETARAEDFPGTGYDLVTTFDCLHDMGDPVAAARHIRQALATDGTWLLVEPFADATVTGNMNPVGRIYYNFSTLLCVPHAIAQGAGAAALGNQAGEPAVHAIAAAAGFSRVRRATETPFNLVFELRP